MRTWRIQTVYVEIPVEKTDWDWVAFFENKEAAGGRYIPKGYGPTEVDAIMDLIKSTSELGLVFDDLFDYERRTD